MPPCLAPDAPRISRARACTAAQGARFPYDIAVRLQTKELLVFDDPLALSPCHFCAIPTTCWCADWRLLLRAPKEGLALLTLALTLTLTLTLFGIPACFLAAITYLLAADFSVSKSSASRVPTPLGCAQGYQPIFQVGGKVDASVSSLLETRAKAIGKAERQLTDDAFRRMGVYVYDHNCSWAARPPPFVEIEGGCTITAVEHCWHECHDTYNYTLTHSERFFGLAVESFTIEETITRTRGASCARNKGCAADGWEDGPPFGTWKLGDISRCWAPTPGSRCQPLCDRGEGDVP